MMKDHNSKTVWQVWIPGAIRPLAERTNSDAAFNIAVAWKTRYPQFAVYLVEEKE